MKKILLSLVAVIMGGFMMAAPVFAECPDGSVPVSILGDSDDIVIGTDGERCLKDDGKGNSILGILTTVVDIMSIGVGVLAVIGISVSGVQYLTAGGSEEKTRKAKRRILEIVIGLIAYVLIYALLKFLLPGFNGVPDKI
jgi:hypothetical protein